MKAIIAVVILNLATTQLTAAQAASRSPVWDYHRNYGMPEAIRLRDLEYSEIYGDQRIVGGSITSIRRIPYQVGLDIQILWSHRSLCVGSLLTRTRVVTAAHCKNDGVTNGQTFTAVLGSDTLFSGGERISGNDVVMHGFWDPSTAANDIAVFRLPTPASLSNLVQPIALPTGNELFQDFIGWTALASGYNHYSDSGTINNNMGLSSVQLPVISNDECASSYAEWLHPSNICTSGAGGRGTCGGDSGGPLVVDSNGRSILIGVTSYGADGCDASLPAVFTRVTTYINWLQAI